jgi:hypothetical protein
MPHHFEVSSGCDVNGTTFSTGLPVVSIKDDPDELEGVYISLVYPGGWANVERGKYVLWPVGAIKQLIGYLETIAGAERSG